MIISKMLHLQTPQSQIIFLLKPLYRLSICENCPRFYGGGVNFSLSKMVLAQGFVALVAQYYISGRHFDLNGQVKSEKTIFSIQPRLSQNAPITSAITSYSGSDTFLQLQQAGNGDFIILYPIDQGLIRADIKVSLKWRHLSVKASQITGNANGCSTAYPG